MWAADIKLDMKGTIFKFQIENILSFKTAISIYICIAHSVK